MSLLLKSNRFAVKGGGVCDVGNAFVKTVLCTRVGLPGRVWGWDRYCGSLHRLSASLSSVSTPTKYDCQTVRL